MTPPTPLTIRPVTAADAYAVARIYNHYITDTVVTFEEEPVSAASMAERFVETAAEGLPWLVAEQGGHVLGYAFASKWKGRCAYRFTAEATVYLDPAHRNKGLGTALYGALFPFLKARGFHSVLGGIALPNAASVALHEKFGMTQVAQLREVGFKFGRWIDVGYWQGQLG